MTYLAQVKQNNESLQRMIGKQTDKSMMSALTMLHILPITLRGKGGGLYKAVVMIGYARVVGNREQGRSMVVLWQGRGKWEKIINCICSRSHVEGGK